jgi:hypothetical protein
MKNLTSVVPTVLLCVGLAVLGFAADDTVPGGPFFAGKAIVQSMDFHKAAIQQHQDKAAVLEQKIQKLEHRLDMVKNSYRDPKGFRSASWKRLIGTWRRELRDIRARIAWHEDRIDRLQTWKK